MFRSAALALALLSLAFAIPAPAPAEAGTPQGRDFLVQNDDGYGTSDCLAKASACGKIVADAWCESKGFGRASSYRPAEATDITSSTSASRLALQDSFVISCSE